MRISVTPGSAHTSVLQGTEAQPSCCSDRLSTVQHVNREEARGIIGTIIGGDSFTNNFFSRRIVSIFLSENEPMCLISKYLRRGSFPAEVEFEFTT